MATFVQSTEMQIFLKPFQPCHVVTGIHWIALCEYSQMSIVCQGFSHSSAFFAHLCVGKISHLQDIRVNKIMLIL